MILVIGATGPTGRAAVHQLVARGVAVRAVTRDPGRAGDLAGAELYLGDSSRPDSLERAFDRVAKVYLAPPTLPGWDSVQTRIIEQAQKAGVEHFVRISALGTRPDAAAMSLRFHWDGERELERSGMTFTHVRANSFFQNTLFDAPSIRSQRAIYSCVGALRFAKVDTRDIGEVVATVLTSSGHENCAHTLTGPKALSYDDLAEIMSDVLDREIRYVDLTPTDYARVLITDGFPEWLAEEIAAIYGMGFPDDSVVAEVTDTVGSILGRPPRTFAEFVDDHRADFR